MTLRIVSLTTIPSRFNSIGPTLKSLLRQRDALDEIRLYIPRFYRRFPNYDGHIPEIPEGVTVVRTEEDLGPASKILFAVKDFGATEAQILFCDDDRIYPPNWAQALFETQNDRPQECVAMIGRVIRPDLGVTSTFTPKAEVAHVRALRSRGLRALSRLSALIGLRTIKTKPVISPGYVDILQGLGGAVVRPEFFDARAFQIPDVLWAVDDFWLSGMLALKGIPIYLPEGLELPDTTDAHRSDPLFKAVIDGVDRVEANKQCVQYMQRTFGVWM